MKKEYKKGMADSAKLFDEKFEKQEGAFRRVADSLKEKMGQVCAAFRPVIDDMSSLKKKELYDLNTQFDLRRDLEEAEEKEFLLAGLYTLSKRSKNTAHQQSFIRSVRTYLGVDNPQTEVILAKVGNFEKVSTQKIIMQVFMEFLFLERGNDSFLRRYADVFKQFNINEGIRNEILQCVKNVYRATGAQGLAEKYGYVPSMDDDDFLSVTSKTIELTDTRIDGILHVAPGEEKVFRNQNISVNSYIRCQGNLTFENCILTYHRDEPSCRIFLEEKALLTLRNCVVVCDVPEESADKKPSDGSFFLNMQGEEVKAAFFNTEFHSCVRYLAAEKSAGIVFESCKIIGIPVEFCKLDYRSAFDMKKCVIQLRGDPEGSYESLFALTFDRQEKLSVCITESVIEQIVSAQDSDKGFVVLDIKGADISKCDFIGINGCIRGAGKISGCFFKDCTRVISGNRYSGSTSVSKCHFDRCEAIISDLRKQSTVEHCRFIDCKNEQISSQGSGGGEITVEFCEFFNLSADNQAIQLDRPKDVGSSTVRNCVFSGVKLTDGWLIGGLLDNKKQSLAVRVENCDFRNVFIEDADGAVFQDSQRFERRLFKAIVCSRVLEVNCRGIESVNKGSGASFVKPDTPSCSDVCGSVNSAETIQSGLTEKCSTHDVEAMIENARERHLEKSQKTPSRFYKKK